MPSRLHSVLTLLLACLVLGAGTQSAVCELACNLGGKTQCHDAAATSMRPSSADRAMSGMPGMRRSGMKNTHASMVVATYVRVEGRDSGMCRHLSTLATVSSTSRNETVQAVHWVVIEPLPAQTNVATHRVAANSNAPPHLPPGNLLLVTLRI